MKSLNRAVILVSAGVLSVTALAACGENPSDKDAPSVADGGTEEVYAAAKEEGELVFYCSVPPALCEGIAAGFSDKYPGIDTQTVRLVSSDMTARWTAEKESRAKTADVLLSSDVPFVTSATRDGLLGSWEELDILPADFPADYLVPELDAPMILEVQGIGYNTDLVDEAEAPKAWTDLEDPKWKGKIVSPSPSVSPVIVVIYGTVQDFAGPQFLENLGEQKISQNPGGSVAATEALGAGEYPVQMAANGGVLATAKENGAPVEYILPPGGSGAPYIWALDSAPAHPNAQKLFAEFVTSKEANELIADLSPYTATPYAAPEGVLPPNFDYYESEEAQKVLDALGVER